MTNTFTTTGGTTHATTISNLTDGNSYTYYVRCEDSANNADTTDYKISFSIAAPTTNTSPSSGSSANSSSTTTTTTITTNPDTASDTATTTTTTTTTSTTTDTDAIPDIFQQTKVRLGNSWKSTDHHLTTNDDSLKLKGQNSDVSTIKVYKGDSLFKTIKTDVNGAWDSILKFKDDFFHTIRIKQYDDSNNLISSNSFKLRLDTEKPKFKETIPDTLTITHNDKIIFTATDDNSGLDHYEVKLYPIRNYWRTQNQGYYQIPQSVPNGAYTLYIRAYDKAGNYAQELIHVTVSDAKANYVPKAITPKTVNAVKPAPINQASTTQTVSTNPIPAIQTKPQVQTPQPETQTSNQQAQPQSDKSSFVWWKPWTWW